MSTPPVVRLCKDFLASSSRPFLQSQYAGVGRKKTIARTKTGRIHCVANFKLSESRTDVDRHEA